MLRHYLLVYTLTFCNTAPMTTASEERALQATAALLRVFQRCHYGLSAVLFLLGNLTISKAVASCFSVIDPGKRSDM